MSDNAFLSRRTLLHGLGAAVALPMLDAMLPRTARAAAGAPAKSPNRMAFLYIANGVHMQDWTPKSEGTDFELPNTLEPLAAHKKSLSVLTGLTLNGGRALGDGAGDHARSVASFLTGAHPRKTAGADIQNGVSVDQVAAEQVGKATRFASLELGTEPSQKSGNCDSGYSCIYSSNLSWRTSTSPMAKEIHPRAVFDRLFGAGSSGDQEKGKWLREEKQQSILDFVNDDAKSLRMKLGSNDQRKMDEYLHAIREIERRIQGDKLPTMEEGQVDFPRPAGTPRDFGDHVRIMLDMLVLSLQTDSTRIASFMFTNDSSNRSYPHLEVKEGHHDLSHHGGDKEKHVKIQKINKYHVGHVAYFLDKMSAVKEGDKTLLDNSMIVYGSGIGDGDRHNHDNLPILLMGHGGGTIAGGRHIKYKKDTPMCNLYLGMLHRMGVKADSFSDSTEPLKGLEG